ncbi:TVP38/TMEM64 family protein [Marinomonas ostreistagni]|uniref:TVP38/TMEM64 family membrane protein n=1 Tax=Marinomonas ostreistagni TaxID=359209 RepID=A0ABS0ZDB0_9GAMM|nr:VTT domain-containing protein [Marinomonas ostreistagni]MBJ7551183.1 VTT domain-containing protein [Marinomonas ostreistagni]
MKFLKIVLLVVLAVLAYGQSNSEIWLHIADKDWIAAYVATHGVQGLVLLFACAVIFTAIGAPRQLIAFTFGFTFGGLSGVLLALLCTILSAVLVYSLAQCLVKQALIRYFDRRYQRFREFVSVDPFSKVLLVRIFPVGSNVITNLLSGAVGVPFMAFVSASALGYLPQTIIFALAGSGFGSANQWQFIVSILLGIVSLVLTSHLYRQYKKQHSNIVTIGE